MHQARLLDPADLCPREFLAALWNLVSQETHLIQATLYPQNFQKDLILHCYQVAHGPPVDQDFQAILYRLVDQVVLKDQENQQALAVLGLL